MIARKTVIKPIIMVLLATVSNLNHSYNLVLYQ